VTGTAAGPYSDVIRKRWRRPAFRGRVADANAVAEDVNPLCGDRVRMELDVEDDRIRAVGFTGDSCAICTASADVVSEKVFGRTVTDATDVQVSDVLEALEADIRPTRMRCVTLPIDVLKKALDR
jgi:nitrogen fixation NifU-like protein